METLERLFFVDCCGWVVTIGIACAKYVEVGVIGKADLGG